MQVFLDTNVFLYAAGGPHPDREACAGLLQRVGEGSLDATVNTEVIQELLFVLARRAAAGRACSSRAACYRSFLACSR